MSELSVPWSLLAHPLTILFVGLCLIFALFFSKKNPSDRLASRGAVVKIFTLGMTTYCFGLCFLTQVVFSNSPSLTELIKLGFGEVRTAYMLMGYVLLGFFDLMYIFFPGQTSKP